MREKSEEVIERKIKEVSKADETAEDEVEINIEGEEEEGIQTKIFLEFFSPPFLLNRAVLLSCFPFSYS